MKDNGPFGAVIIATTRHIDISAAPRCVATTKTADGREFVGTGMTYPEAIKAAQRARKAANSHNLTGKGEL